MKLDLFKYRYVILYLRFINKLRKKSHIGAKTTRMVAQKSSLILPSSKNVTNEKFDENYGSYEVIKSSNSSDYFIFHIHGGAFCLGSVDTHRNMFNYLVENSDCTILAPEYPLSPENRFPDQVHHINQMFEEIIKEYPNKKWIISGDSAGGNLAINLIQFLRRKNYDCEALVLMSPWVDLRDESYAISAMVDDLSGFDSDDVAEFAKLYCKKEELDLPEVSPVLMNDFENFPRTLIQTSKSEILYNDIKFFEKKVKASGVQYKITEEDGLFHSWQLFPDFSERARKSLDEVIEFISER